jgi:hypothetical protein
MNRYQQVALGMQLFSLEPKCERSQVSVCACSLTDLEDFDVWRLEWRVGLQRLLGIQCREYVVAVRQRKRRSTEVDATFPRVC